jgi:hypothetical protein
VIRPPFELLKLERAPNPRFSEFRSETEPKITPVLDFPGFPGLTWRNQRAGPCFDFAMDGLQTELTDGLADGLRQSELSNEDLAPVPPALRKWRAGSFAALWISMSACIPTYMLASSLIGGGMNWWEAVLTRWC